MVAELHFDAREIEQLSRAIHNLPGEIKAKAMARAMRRMRDMARTRIVQYHSKRLSLPPSRIRKLTTASFNAGGNTIDIVEKSGWIPLIDLAATQNRKGVRTRYRGSYKSAFIATMKNGHRGVFIRSGKKRLPIRELFGPNPAHDITNNPDEFLRVLAELVEDQLAPRVLHEIENLIRK